MGVMPKMVSEIATVKWLRSSKRNPEDCTCCEGVHIYARVTEEGSVPTEFVRNALHELPEGARFTVTVETVDDIEDAVSELRHLADHHDSEHVHSRVDDILLRFVPPQIASAYQEAKERVGFYYA